MSYRLLIPLDGSPQSETTLPFVRALARATQIEATLLRCYDSTVGITVLPETSGAAMVSDAQLADLSREYLENQQTELSGISSRLVVKRGDAANEILTLAREVDLVTMASRGRSGISQWLLGGVTTKVERTSPTPVVVMAGPPLDDSYAVRTILVAVDRSELAKRALKAACQLARAVCANLVLYTAVSERVSALDLPNDLAEAEDHLRDLANSCSGLEVRYLAGPYEDHPDIVTQAELAQADLIVLGSSGRQGLSRWMLGSVAENVLASSSRPVMIVH